MDRVQVLKRESSALGGQGVEDVDYPSPIEPREDAIEAAGLYVQDAINRDQTTLISRSGTDMLFKDGANPGGYTLTQLAAASGISLFNEPSGVDTSHSVSRDSTGRAMVETWISVPGGLTVKTVTYTRTTCKRRIATERHRLYGVDGVTVTQEGTKTYTRTGNKLTSTSFDRTI